LGKIQKAAGIKIPEQADFTGTVSLRRICAADEKESRLTSLESQTACMLLYQSWGFMVGSSRRCNS
jgi:hypothetical protein